MRLRTQTLMMCLATAGLLVAAASGTGYDCPVLTTAADSNAGNAGTIQNVGQVVIGRATSRVDGITMHAGVIPCYVFGGGGSSLGDMNCDGFVTVGDIGPFVLALTDPAAYALQYPDCDINNGDINQDGFVTVGDIGAFVALLTGL
ncbi:MAG: hypothetical protein SF069_01955 [Phycisphaerae bacterium]|nr:hypothetical protein [Phycisphaerae bacterium]